MSDMSNKMKQCTKCKQWLKLSCFGKDRQKKDSLMCWCKFCYKPHSQAHYETHREEIKDNYQVNYLRATWFNMIYRCTNPEHKDYKYYGGRGITVCQRWLDSFEDFKKDIGERSSPQHTIDRIANEGNYEPSNVKWSTRKEQRNNQRNFKKEIA